MTFIFLFIVTGTSSRNRAAELHWSFVQELLVDCWLVCIDLKIYAHLLVIIDIYSE